MIAHNLKLLAFVFLGAMEGMLCWINVQMGLTEIFIVIQIILSRNKLRIFFFRKSTTIFYLLHLRSEFSLHCILQDWEFEFPICDRLAALGEHHGDPLYIRHVYASLPGIY